jgi:hypothetical protein
MKMAQIVAHRKTDQIRNTLDRQIGQTIQKRTIRLLPAMPIEVMYHTLNVVVSFEKHEENFVFTLRYSKTQPKRYDDWKVNAYALRETFLDIMTPGEAFDFLSLAGPFRRPPNRRSPERITWSDFQKWQEIVRLLLRQGGALSFEEIGRSEKGVTVRYAVPDHLHAVLRGLSAEEKGWLHAYPDQLVIRSDDEVIEGRRKTLRAEIMVGTTIEAVLATAYVDNLIGINYGLCALPDCPRLYEITSKHKRGFCSQACGHKASVRNRRTAERAKRN